MLDSRSLVLLKLNILEEKRWGYEVKEGVDLEGFVYVIEDKRSLDFINRQGGAAKGFYAGKYSWLL